MNDLSKPAENASCKIRIDLDPTLTSSRDAISVIGPVPPGDAKREGPPHEMWCAMSGC